jgi:DNA-binding MarR family transcriptional regulator
MRAVDVERSVSGDGCDTIATLVFHVAREMRTALERKLSSHGVTAQQATLARLLRAWERKKKPSPFQVAARLGTDGAGMTRLIDRLEAKGVVVRKVGIGDRRLISIELTATGLAIAKKAAPTFENVNRQLLEGFTEPEVEQLTDMLRRLGDNARRLSA